MIKIFYAKEKTNGYRPEPWAWSTDPFPAFRGKGQRYNAFLAVANGFTPWFSSHELSDNKAMSDDYCKIIKTKKGGNLLVPCRKEEDEKILLITALGGFRGAFGKIEAVGAEIIWRNGMSMHCCPVEHIIARITEPDGYIRTETGCRCAHGYTEIYSWKGGYFGMNTDEYEAAVETGVLFYNRDTIQADLERCKAIRAEQKASREARADFLPRFEAANEVIKRYHPHPYDLSGETFATREESCYSGVITKRFFYNEETVTMAEQEAERLQKSELWSKKFREVAHGYEIADSELPWYGTYGSGIHFGGNYVEVAVRKNGSEIFRKSYYHNEENLASFAAELPDIERRFLANKTS